MIKAKQLQKKLEISSCKHLFYQADKWFDDDGTEHRLDKCCECELGEVD